MTTRSNLASTATRLLGVIAFLSSLHAAPLELDILRQQYDKLVVEPYETGKADLVVKFSTALENAMEAAQQNGHLDELIALQGEQKRLADRLPIPNAEEEAPETLKKLRSIYHEQLTALETKRDATAGEILPAYTTKLKELESTLTKGGRIPDALLVKNYRDGLANGPVSALPATMPVATSAPVPATTTTPAPRFKGDDRKAAEWVMANWRDHRIFVGDTQLKVSADLPSGRFQITSIELEGDDYIGPTTLDGDVFWQNLGGLEKLNSLALRKFSELKDADFAFVSTLESLVELRLGGCAGITDDVVPHLVSLRLLREFAVSEAPGFTGRTLFQLSNLSVESLQFFKCNINDAGMSGLAGFRNLKILEISGEKGVTDASLAPLRSLPAMDRLLIASTSITPVGLAASPWPRVTHLACNEISRLPLSEIVPTIAPAFPNLVGFSLSYNIRNSDDISALAHFKRLKHLSDAGYVEDTAWPGLLTLTDLEFFTHYLKSKKVSDAALNALSGLKKLKRIDLGSEPPSPAALAAFKAARPDVEIKN